MYFAKSCHFIFWLCLYDAGTRRKPHEKSYFVLSVHTMPVQNCTIPVRNCTIPVQNCTIPVRNCTIPVRNCTIPVQNCTIPVRNCTIPVQNCTIPVQNCTIPVQNCTIPVRNCTIPSLLPLQNNAGLINGMWWERDALWYRVNTEFGTFWYRFNSQLSNLKLFYSITFWWQIQYSNSIV